MKSIRQRLALGLVAGLSVLVLAVAAVILPMVHRALVSEFDYALLAKARALTALADPARRGVSLQFTEANLPEFQPGGGEFFEVTLADGTVLARSESLAGGSLKRAGSASAFYDTKLPDGASVRTTALRFAQDGANDVEVLFARDRARLDRTLLLINVAAALGGIAILALIWLVVNRGVRAGLRPVGKLAREVTGITSASLEKRVGTDVPEELQPIANELNRLLEHLHAAFARERRFTSDAAHELSTPIAELRALTDVALRWRDDPAVTANLAEKANAIAQQLERVVRVLLALARAENVRAEVRFAQVDVSATVRELVASVTARCAARDIQLRDDIQAAVTATDGAVLRALLLNILDNAVEYTPRGGIVECSVQRSGQEIVIAVSNTQNSLAADDLAHLFEPLWRKDAARAGAGHFGVGLALVKAYAEALQARVSAELVGDRLRVTTFVPLRGQALQKKIAA